MTIERIKEALEQANGEAETYEDDTSVYLCPSCNELVVDTFNIKTHCICGQRLDWG